jgi:hypothetical protein
MGAANALSDELAGPFQKGRGGPGGWVFFVEPELNLGAHVRAGHRWLAPDRLPPIRCTYFEIEAGLGLRGAFRFDRNS